MTLRKLVCKLFGHRWKLKGFYLPLEYYNCSMCKAECMWNSRYDREWISRLDDWEIGK